MIKEDLVNALYGTTVCYNMSKKDVRAVVNELFRIITNTVLNGEDVQIRGFGHFSTRYRKSRIINHPATKEQVVSLPKLMLYFNPARNIKRALKEKGQISQATDTEV